MAKMAHTPWDILNCESTDHADRWTNAQTDETDIVPATANTAGAVQWGIQFQQYTWETLSK